MLANSVQVKFTNIDAQVPHFPTPTNMCVNITINNKLDDTKYRKVYVDEMRNAHIKFDWV